MKKELSFESLKTLGFAEYLKKSEELRQELVAANLPVNEVVLRELSSEALIHAVATMLTAHCVED